VYFALGSVISVACFQSGHFAVYMHIYKFLRCQSGNMVSQVLDLCGLYT
jgi:predicted MFS family arabinose efflux permease